MERYVDGRARLSVVMFPPSAQCVFNFSQIWSLNGRKEEKEGSQEKEDGRAFTVSVFSLFLDPFSGRESPSVEELKENLHHISPKTSTERRNCNRLY